MDPATLDQQMAATLEHVCEHWRACRKAADEGRSPAHPFTIALSRQKGTEATTLARELGRRLGWPTYDQELLERIAQDMGLRRTLLESVDEKRLPWLQNALDEFMGVPVVTDSAYAHHLIKTVLALGAQGECVIVGRGAAFILPAPTTLRVLLIAPREHRIATVSRKLGIARHEAERQVDNIDRERRQFVREVFQKNLDVTDDVLYDLVLNVSRFSVAACAQVIIEALHQQQSRTENTRIVA